MKESEKEKRVVFKFGGSSLQTMGRIRNVALLCKKNRPSAVIVSAQYKETERLVELANSICSSKHLPEYDLLVTTGEQKSVALLCLAMREVGLNPYPLFGGHAGLITDAAFSEALIQAVHPQRLIDIISKKYIPVIAGFQGITQDGQISSLGRGGSDITAVAIAASIKAKECVIYSDVDGIYSIDPKLTSNATPLPYIDKNSLLELAINGSKVVHNRSIKIAIDKKIDLAFKNTFTDLAKTKIVNLGSNMNCSAPFERGKVRSITFVENKF